MEIIVKLMLCMLVKLMKLNKLIVKIKFQMQKWPRETTKSHGQTDQPSRSPGGAEIRPRTSETPTGHVRTLFGPIGRPWAPRAEIWAFPPTETPIFDENRDSAQRTKTRL